MTHQARYRGFSKITLIVVAAFIVLVLFFVNSGSHSPTGTNTATSSAQQASSTLNQALKLSGWLAKEYAPQKH